MTSLPRVCLLGPMLGRHSGWVISQGEVLAEVLADEGYPVETASHHRAPLPRTAHILTSLIRRRRAIDVVVLMVFSGRGFLISELASRLARVLGLKQVHWLHGGDLPQFSQRHPAWVRRHFGRAELLIAPSPYLAQAFEGWAPGVEVVENVVRLGHYPFRQRQRLDPRLFWMRTFHPLYNPFLALEVLHRLRRRHPEATLTMAGQDRGLLAATKSRAATLGVANAVRFPGFLDAEGKRRELGAHDIFLNTNRVDNTPVTVLEAGAAGLPIVATRVGGIPHLLSMNEDALLVPDDDAEAMTAAVERLLGDAELAGRLSAEGRRLAERSDAPNVAARWKDILKRVAPTPDGPRAAQSDTPR